MMNVAFNAILMALLLFMPENSTNAARQALRIWGLELVPSLFPYMVLCQTLTQSILRKKKASVFLPFAFGLLGGSPSASASLALIAAHRPLGRKKTLFLCALAGTISPMFFLSLAASWFSSIRVSVLLLLSQYVGAVLSGGVFYALSSDDVPCRNHPPIPPSKENDDPLTKSVHAVLNVGGCIVFYSTAASCLQPLFPSNFAGLSPCLHAVLEISGGLHALSAAPLSPTLKVITASGVCAFGSLSILNQNFLFLGAIGVKKRELLLLCAARSLFSMLTTFLLLVIV